jgi:GNAT superfamily N-acetyltransferase
MKIKYVNLEESILSEVLNGLSRIFAKNEPMGRVINITPDSVAEFLKPVIDISLDTSIVAIDEDVNNKVVGAFIVIDFFNHDKINLKNADKIKLEKCNPIEALLNTLESRFVDIHKKNSFQKGYYAYEFAIYVENDYSHKGIGKELAKQAEKKSIENGFKSIVTIATGSISQTIFKHRNFTQLDHIVYKDFDFNGNKVFEELGESCCILYEKEIN